MINWLFRGWLSLAMIVDDVLLKNQVTSYFLENNITAITKVITDVWRKGWARSIVAFSLGQGDPLPGLAVRRLFVQLLVTASTFASADIFCADNVSGNIWPLPRRNRWTRYSGWRWCHVVPTCQQTNSTSTRTRLVTGYLSARASTSVQSTTDDQVVPVHALVQLLQAVIASSCCRTISGLTKVLVRLAMTLHTWSRIVMWCISSNRCLTAMEYFDLKALAICLHC